MERFMRFLGEFVNKIKIFQSIIFVIALCISHFSFAMVMKKVALYGMQSFAAGIFLSDRMKSAHEKYKARKEWEIQSQKLPDMPLIVQEWAKTEATRLNIPNSKAISFKIDNEWASRENVIFATSENTVKLEKILQNELRSDEANKFINENKMILRHELGHLINKDSQNRIRALYAFPWLIQAGFMGKTYVLNKMFKIKPSKTWLGVVGCSAFAFSSIPFKIVIDEYSRRLYDQYHEKKADTFACMNAENKSELEAYYDYFTRERKDRFIGGGFSFSEFFLPSTHPDRFDRAAHCQEYIDNWDQNHLVPQDDQGE
jgi:hypothetical protein